MSTMAQAIRAILQDMPTGATRKQIRDYIDARFPGQWKPGTLTAHLYGCQVNNTTAYRHHPSAEKFLFKADNDLFYIYDENTHGENIWRLSDADAELIDEEDIEQRVEASITYERDVEEHLIRNLGAIEKGLTFIARQERIEVGIVDILAQDSGGRRVVIELKVGEAKDAVIGQIARYLGWYARVDKQRPRGMVIASDFPDPIRYAAEAIPDLSLVTYRVQFSFNKVGVEES